ncbi:hypothetical protein MKW92_038142 [Papaver armeniacum]|nr:hypothetical protein MKW92_038142 [Papaver armeniacum]
MVVNIAACVCSAVSVILIGNQCDLAVLNLDLIILSLLGSANGAAAAVEVLGYLGNSHTQWNEVCNVFDRYCRHTYNTIILSLSAAKRLHRRCL